MLTTLNFLVEIEEERMNGNVHYRSKNYEMALKNYTKANLLATTALSKESAESVKEKIYSQMLLIKHNTILTLIKTGCLKKARKVVDEALAEKNDLLILKDKILVLAKMGYHEEVMKIKEEFNIEDLGAVKKFRIYEIENVTKMLQISDDFLLKAFESLNLNQNLTELKNGKKSESLKCDETLIKSSDGLKIKSIENMNYETKENFNNSNENLINSNLINSNGLIINPAIETVNNLNFEELSKNCNFVDKNISILRQKSFLMDNFCKIDEEFFYHVIKKFKEGKILCARLVCEILREAYAIHVNSSNIVYIDTKKKVYVFGDTHGQYFDLFSVLEKMSTEKDAKFVFNGDFVDRGPNSVENMIFLFLLKILHPSKIFLNRGNHEFSDINNKYGFVMEIQKKYPEISSMLHEIFSLVFSVLPIVTVLNRKIFIVHGGIPDSAITLQTIDEIDRNYSNTINDSVFNALMWADPYSGDINEPYKRNCGVRWCPETTKKFLEMNNLAYIVRSHEFVDGGFREEHDGKVLTIFSCPDYCGGKNSAAYLIFNDCNYEVVNFNSCL